MEKSNNALGLGIDIGTTKIGVVICSKSSKEVLEVRSAPHSAAVNSKEGIAEQSVPKIMQVLNDLVADLPATLREKIISIGVTGQMHGSLLFNPSNDETSNLVTWQDKRSLLDKSIEEFRNVSGDKTLSTGFGVATLAWYAKFKPEMLSQFSKASSIHDYLVYRLIGSKNIFTDPTDAASWGCFDLRKLQWYYDQIAALKIPKNFLPEVISCGSKAGELCSEYAKKWGLKPNIPVAAAIGDNQASLFSTISDPETQAALTIGTGGQFSVVNDSIPNVSLEQGPQRFDVRPYVGGKYIIVGASLAGGDAFAFLANTIENWGKELGLPAPSKDDIFKSLDQKAIASADSNLNVCSSLIGERFNPDLRASVSNISTQNLTLGNLAYATAKDIVINLRDMLPAEVWKDKKVIIGSGNGIRKLACIRKAIEREFYKPLELVEGKEEAATGAAYLAMAL